MGADLMMAYMPWCKLTPEREHAVREIVDSLTDKDLEFSVDFLGAEYLLGDHVEGARKKAHECLDRYKDMDGYRDTAIFYINGARYIFSGGMSWGDSPTESYDDIAFLGEIDKLVRRLKKWSVEDIRAVRKSRSVT